MFLSKSIISQIGQGSCRKLFRIPQKHMNQSYMYKHYSSLIGPNSLKCCTNFLYSGHIEWSLKRISKPFHTSKPKYALPGFIYLLFKPVLRFAAVIVARVSRKWWARLSSDQKKKVYSYISKHQSKIIGTSLISTGMVYIYYFMHLETCPITGRQKFIIIKPSQLQEITKLTNEVVVETYKDQFLKSGHSVYLRIAVIVKRILDANRVYLDHFNDKYTITIIDDPTMNAFVLPDGKIFIFTGMFQVCQTDDELAAVLSHELAHTLLKHSAENISKKTFFEILYLVPLMLICFLLPASGALLTHLLLDDLKAVMFELPHERDQETEADEVGLKLMARACYDVRIVPLFWKKMAIKETLEQVELKNHEYLSSHPSSESRATHLGSKLEEAIELRKECNCSPLSVYKPVIQVSRPATPA